MDFKDRVVNLISYIVMDYIWTGRMLSKLPEFAEEFNFTLHVPLRDVFKNKVTILNADYVLDMPLPMMAHICPFLACFTRNHLHSQKNSLISSHLQSLMESYF